MFVPLVSVVFVMRRLCTGARSLSSRWTQKASFQPFSAALFSRLEQPRYRSAVQRLAHQLRAVPQRGPQCRRVLVG